MKCPVEIDLLLKKGVGLHKKGQLVEANRIYGQVLKRYPDHPDANHLTGLICFDQGCLNRAKDFIRRSIRIKIDESNYYVSLAEVYQAEKRSEEAGKYYRKALKLNPGSIEALCNFGNFLSVEGKFSQAIACYRKAAEREPDSPQVFNNLGLAYLDQKKMDAAITCFTKALTCDPSCVEAYSNLGIVYKEKGDFDSAIDAYQHALALCPRNTTVNYNLALLYQKRRKMTRAIDCYYQAVKNHPPIADAYNNLGKYYQDNNQLEKAVHHYDKTIELDPGHFDAQFNRSLALLAAGKFKEGWQGYEWRFRRAQWKRVYPHRLKGERWKGDPFSGKTLFIHSEQGFGDIIWHARYLPIVKKMGGRIVFETKTELLELFRHSFSVDQLIPMSHRQPSQVAYDQYIPLMSLPKEVGTTVDNIPATVPYIRPSKRKKRQWKKRVDGPEFKVGLVWAAGKTHQHERSCPAEAFLPLFKLPHIKIYGLQKGEEAELASSFFGRIDNLGPDLESFFDTAGAIACLDLIIAVDTAVAHLAGAMGKPVWVLLPYAADWKWFLGREDSPWYPTMRLFRQKKPGNWQQVVTEVKKGLIRQLQTFETTQNALE